MQDNEINLTIPVAALKEYMINSFVKDFVQSLGSEFDPSLLGRSIQYDAFVDPSTRSLILTLVLDASLIKVKQLPKYVTNVEFGGKLTTRVVLDMEGMLSNYGKVVHMDDERIVIAVSLDKLQNEILPAARAQQQILQQVAQSVPKSKGVIEVR